MCCEELTPRPPSHTCTFVVKCNIERNYYDDTSRCEWEQLAKSIKNPSPSCRPILSILKQQTFGFCPSFLCISTIPGNPCRRRSFLLKSLVYLLVHPNIKASLMLWTSKPGTPVLTERKVTLTKLWRPRMWQVNVNHFEGETEALRSEGSKRHSPNCSSGWKRPLSVCSVTGALSCTANVFWKVL